MLDYSADKLQKREPIPEALSYDQIADEVIRGKRTLSPQQMRLLIEIYPYYKPKLTAVAHYQGSFAEALEKAIERRANRPPPSKLTLTCESDTGSDAVDSTCSASESALP